MALLYAGNPHEVMHVISMRHVLRTAGWPVDVCVPMGTAIMFRRASVRVISSGGDPMVTHVVATHIANAVVKMVGVAIVPHSRVAAILSATATSFKGYAFARQPRDCLKGYL
jgi:hypothetical protein